MPLGHELILISYIRNVYLGKDCLTFPLYISKKLAPTVRSAFLYLELSNLKTSLAKIKVE